MRNARFYRMLGGMVFAAVIVLILPVAYASQSEVKEIQSDSSGVDDSSHKSIKYEFGRRGEARERVMEQPTVKVLMPSEEEVRKHNEETSAKPKGLPPRPVSEEEIKASGGRFDPRIGKYRPLTDEERRNSGRELPGTRVHIGPNRKPQRPRQMPIGAPIYTPEQQRQAEEAGPPPVPVIRQR
ncbi:MAG: hypothetical protein HZC51_13475 [Nitrospirae bacterium]|nr:hypothetical protein [Nitrospirota bacterium]